MHFVTPTVHDLRRRWRQHKHRLGSHPTALRFERACGWLQRAEKLTGSGDLELILVSQWTALDCLCGRWDGKRGEPLAERKSWQLFIKTCLRLDTSDSLINLALFRHKSLYLGLMDHEYFASLSNGLGNPAEDSSQGDRSPASLPRGLLELVERLYLMKCQLVFGDARATGKQYRSALKKSNQMLGYLVPQLLTIYMDHGTNEDWGPLCLPSLKILRGP